MNKYRVVYGYCHPHAILSHPTRTKICNTFDEAKNFIDNLPKTSFRIGNKDCKCSDYSGLGIEPSNLYAKIICEGKDFWIFGNPNEIWMRKGYIGSKENNDINGLNKGTEEH